MNKTVIYAVMTVLILLSSACGQKAVTGTSVWIDVPVNNLVLAELQPVLIEGHAASPGGISRVDVFIDGSLLTTIQDPAGQDELAGFSAAWTPDQPGTYVIQTVAYGKDGSASEPDNTAITIGGVVDAVTQDVTVTPSFTPVISITPDISITPTVTDTPTATPTKASTPTKTSTPVPEPLIEFWADPAEIAAGGCTYLRWNAVNVSTVVFGGVEQPFSGSDQECTCEDRTYTLKVTLLNGTNVERSASVNVNSSCVTEVPPDTTPPPVPSPQVPANGLSISCKASQSLAWLPVSDASKIREYQVEIQRSSDNSSWSAAPGSPKTGLTDKTTSIPVECGWYYRWRVRAVDGVGNVSDWSGWSTFVINLS
ncbi:MAG TPA: Ig-like domain-containing protein [Anaerolineaceae bacterium]|nr:Ig-like domain-containing protein [Anaerolineaceae bacterium]